MSIAVDRARLSTALATASAMLAALPLAPAAAGAWDAAIEGTVIDATGLVLPGVTVEARNQASGDVSTAFTDGTGRFVIGTLAPRGCTR